MSNLLQARNWIACVTLTASALSSTATSQDNLYYPSNDGSVRAISLTTGARTRTIPSALLGSPGQGAVRQIAFDATSNRLWYSAVNGILRSIDVRTFIPGPTITQASIPGGFSTRARSMAIDNVRQRLFVGMRTGGVAIFNVGGLLPRLFGTILPSAFLGTNAFEFREFAVDPRTGNLWYASSDSVIRELSLTTQRGTGRFIARSELLRGGSGVLRSFTIDPVRDLLIYASTTGGVEAVNLTSLRRDPFALSGNVFGNTAVGPLRILATDVRGFLGVVTSVGAGCRGTATTPRLSTFLNRVPVVGRSFVMSYVSGARNGIAMMRIGLLAAPRPAPGAPGCTIYVRPMRVVPLTGRFAVFATRIPRTPAMVGREVSYQLVAPDRDANSAGLIYSNALRTLIGTHAPPFSFRLRRP